jgi:caffeic acid 3-O-methyltransferase
MKSASKTLDGDIDHQQEENTFPYAMQVATSIVLPMAMQSAVELGVFEILAKAGPGAKLSPSQIVQQMPTKNPEAAVMLDRILRMLATHSLLCCSVVADDSGSFNRLYSLSDMSKHFVSNEDGVSFGPFMALLQDKVFIDSWSVFYLPHLLNYFFIIIIIIIIIWLFLHYYNFILLSLSFFFFF